MALVLVLLAAPPSASAALARLEQAVRKRPKDLRLRFLLGKQYTRSGKHKRAIQQYQAILKKRPLPTVMFQLGLAHARTGNLTAAVLSWTPILEKKPNNTKTMGYLGLALYKQGLASPNEELRQRLFEESLDWWKRILKLDPSNLRARYFAGVEYFKLGRYEDAARQWLIFLRVKRNHAKVLMLLTKALLKMGKADKASRTLDHLEGLPLKGKMARKVQAFARQARGLLAEGLPSSGAGQGRAELDRDERDENAYQRDPEEVRPPRPVPPDGPEPPPPPPLRGPNPPPPLEDENDSLQAETLFLDGLEYKEKGNYEKALFAFLQAIEIQPEFAQVFLQIGEVYLGLAKLAPRPTEFLERLRLAEDALDKVKNLSPGTLLAHAAQSKLVVVKRSQSLGFNGYHEQVAKKAVQENRVGDAFDQYVILLSVKDFRPRIFFQLAGLVKHLTEANRQDLRFFLEELARQNPGHAMTSYLLGRVYLAAGGDEAATKLAVAEFEQAWDGFARDGEVREEYLTYASTPRADVVDWYVSAKMYAKMQKIEEAMDAVVTFLEIPAPEDHLFYREAVKLKEQLAVALRPVQAGAAQKDHFQEERQLLERTVRESHLFFKLTDEGVPQLSPGHLEDEARFRAVRIFVDNNPANGLGRFLLGWLIQRRSQNSRDPKAGYERGRELIDRVHLEHVADPRYHLQMALACLRWSIVDSDMGTEAERFLKTTRHCLLALGRTHDKATAQAALEGARTWVKLGKPDTTAKLLEWATRYDPSNLQAHALRFDLAWREGSLGTALGGVFSWLFDAMRHLWVRNVLLSDLAILIFMTLLLAALAWAAVLSVRYHAELHYVVAEFWRTKGVVLPLSLFMPIALVVLFPTGLVLFVPFLAWPAMRAAERRIFGLLIGGMMLVPVFLPLSMETNYQLLGVYERISSGDLGRAAADLEAGLDAEDPDPIRLYLLGLVHLRLGDLEKADAALTKLERMETTYSGVKVNRAVLLARQGDYEAAEKHLTQALSRNPSNARALWNLSCLHAVRGTEDKAEQYRRWAETAGGDTLPIAELSDIPPEITRLPLLDQPLEARRLEPYFDFYSGSNFFAFNSTLLYFLGWLLAGGGLCGMLVFARERLDIQFSELYKQTEGELPQLRERAWNQARGLNLALPGLGLTYVGRPVVGTGFFLVVAFLYQLWWSGGGYLTPRVFPTPHTGPVEVLLGLALVAGLALHLVAQYLLWTRQGDVEAR